jgi:hypothetical protein
MNIFEYSEYNLPQSMIQIHLNFPYLSKKNCFIVGFWKGVVRIINRIINRIHNHYSNFRIEIVEVEVNVQLFCNLKRPIPMRITFILFLLLLGDFSNAQINLIPNPSFEDTLSCPDIPGPYVSSARFWTSYRGTPDLMHICANNGPTYPNGQPVLGVPYNRGGYQAAKHGDAYGGLYTFLGPQNNNMREYMGTILTSYLMIGTTYYFSCYISNGDSVESNSSTNNFGMTLSTIPYNTLQGLTMTIMNNSILNIDTIVHEKINWVRFAGSFVADSAYRFLALGNFYSDVNTQVDSTQGFVPLAYYYVDAVCLTTDSLYNEVWTEAYEINHSPNPLIYPNPAISYFNFNNTERFHELVLVDFAGRKRKHFALEPGPNNIDVSNLPQGVYFILIDRYKVEKLIVVD